MLNRSIFIKGCENYENISIPVISANYMGPESDQIHIQFIGSSDSAWSDIDCLWPTEGHTNLDDIAVAFNGTQVIFDDFESGLGNWTAVSHAFVGDFSKVWPQLYDIDPCRSNGTPQFAFIDDGIVVPGTGGTYGQSWTYGPGGFAVNCNGGLAGPDYHLNNEIWSPVLTIPASNYNGCIYSFDVYRHQILDNSIFYLWKVQSSLDSGQSWSEWKSHNYLYYGDPEYLRHEYDVTTLIDSGSNAIRVSLGAYEYAAATVNIFNNNQVVFLPFAYKNWNMPDGSVAVDVLADILSNFNLIGVDVPDDEIPGTVFSLNCSPNPFNPRSEISYNMPTAGNLKITVFNTRGEEVCVLLNEEVEAGSGSVIWSGQDASSKPVASGVYFVESRSSSKSLVKKLTLVR